MPLLSRDLAGTSTLTTSASNNRMASSSISVSARRIDIERRFGRGVASINDSPWETGAGERTGGARARDGHGDDTAGDLGKSSNRCGGSTKSYNCGIGRGPLFAPLPYSRGSVSAPLQSRLGFSASLRARLGFFRFLTGAALISLSIGFDRMGMRHCRGGRRLASSGNSRFAPGCRGEGFRIIRRWTPPQASRAGGR
jgi:hypothetical protein